LTRHGSHAVRSARRWRRWRWWRRSAGTDARSTERGHARSTDGCAGCIAALLARVHHLTRSSVAHDRCETLSLARAGHRCATTQPVATHRTSAAATVRSLSSTTLASKVSRSQYATQSTAARWCGAIGIHEAAGEALGEALRLRKAHAVAQCRRSTTQSLTARRGTGHRAVGPREASVTIRRRRWNALASARHHGARWHTQYEPESEEPGPPQDNRLRFIVSLGVSRACLDSSPRIRIATKARLS
jgi:hypothetical protein